MPVENIQLKQQAKVLLLSVGTGEGHNSAARAIAEVLREKNIECELKDSVEFKGKRSHGFITNGYGQIVRGAPALFGMAYVIGAAYEDLRLPSPIYSYHKSYADKVYKYIKDNGYNCVICTHLFSMHTATAIRNLFDKDLPCYGVVTDYTAIPFYSGTKLDAYFVPDERTRGMLVRRRIPADRIHCKGIPVSPKFAAELSKAEARDALGIPADKKVIVVSTGGAGCGKIKQLCKRLLKKTGDDISVYVLTGRNDGLKARLDKKFAQSGRVTAVGFTPDVHLYVKAADIAVGKPGGLSSTEVAVAGVPLVLLKAIPGCETYNKRYFIKHNMAVYGKTIRDAVSAVKKLLADEQYARTMVENQKRVIDPRSVNEIVEYVLNDFHSKTSASAVPVDGGADAASGAVDAERSERLELARGGMTI